MTLPPRRILLNAIWVTVLAMATLSCSEHDEQPDPAAGLVKVGVGYAAAIKVEVYAKEELYAGYNPVYVLLHDSASGKRLDNATVLLNPQMQGPAMKHSCPVVNPEISSESGLLAGSILFTMPSNEMGSWTLGVVVENPLTNRSGRIWMDIHVKPVSPAQAHSFTTEIGERYYWSYYFPEKMKVGINAFDVIVFTLRGDEFIPREDLIIRLSPQMLSMDHGSPNNEAPVHSALGHYRGKVNFTMTGEWRINLELSTTTSPLKSTYFDVTVQ